LVICAQLQCKKHSYFNYIAVFTKNIKSCGKNAKNSHLFL
jgi:hypothetical protein